MEKSQLLRLLPLNELVTGLLDPVARACRVAGITSKLKSVRARADFVEAFSWLDMGVQLGLYPREAAKVVASEYFHLLPSPDEEFSKFWGGVFDPYVMQRLYSSRSRRLLFSGRYSDLPIRSSRFLRIFELCVRAATDFVLNPLTRELVTALVFLRPDAFDSLIEQEVSVSDVADVMAASKSSNEFSIQRIIAGYLRALQHMEAAVMMLGDDQRDPEIDRGEWAVFRIRLLAVSRWRLDFHNAVVSGRFWTLAERVESMLIAGAKRHRAELVPGGFFAFTKQLGDRWSGLTVPASKQAGE
jgi:hypothetical protein